MVVLSNHHWFDRTAIWRFNAETCGGAQPFRRSVSAFKQRSAEFTYWYPISEQSVVEALSARPVLKAANQLIATPRNEDEGVTNQRMPLARPPYSLTGARQRVAPPTQRHRRHLTCACGSVVTSSSEAMWRHNVLSDTEHWAQHSMPLMHPSEVGGPDPQLFVNSRGRCTWDGGRVSSDEWRPQILRHMPMRDLHWLICALEILFNLLILT